MRHSNDSDCALQSISTFDEVLERHYRLGVVVDDLGERESAMTVNF